MERHRRARTFDTVDVDRPRGLSMLRLTTIMPPPPRPTGWDRRRRRKPGAKIV
jgi:hypothetical protein